MVTPRHTKLQVPVELSRYVYHNRLITPFSIYLYLKLFSDGKLRKTSSVFINLRRTLRLSDNRTFNKHINKLIELTWLRYNPKTDMYFIRSFDYVRRLHTFKKRRASTFMLKDVTHVQTYLVGVLLSVEVIGQKYVWEYKKRRKWRAATKKTDVANHSKVFSAIPEYYGCSVATIAKILGCKPTRASVLKKNAAAAGYLKVKHRFVLYAKLTKADFNLRPNINDMFPALRGKLRIKAIKVGRFVEYQVLFQCHDEISSLMKFKTVSKFNNLQVSPAIISYINKLIKNAA
jgi:hypothetical protein